ncbi:MAG: NAD(P)-dependent oxidoreductase [Planctomycetales bacterium]|nr:NAD(P)-dependent oxidoreductase [Planctomycetales bacterium]
MVTTVLVTGGSGFVGTWVLRELLARGIRPVVLDVIDAPERWRRVLGENAARVSFVPGSLLDRDRLAQVCDEFHVTHIIHLAALLTPACQQDPWTGCQVNVLGSVALFEQARIRPQQIRGLSYASSLAVFGPEPDDAVAGAGAIENRPPTFYGAFKQAVELIAEQYWRHFQVASVGIRPHVVYGPERDQGLTAGPSLAARAAARGEPFTINYTGRVGYDYVEDVALAFVRSALDTPAGACVVDLPSEPATVDEIVATIDAVVPGAAARLSVAGSAIPSNIPSRLQLISSLFPDWQATTLANGIRKTVDFYRSSCGRE